MKALKNLRNNKAPAGMDNNHAELFKQGRRKLKQCILNMIIKVWRKKRISQKWKEGFYVHSQERKSEEMCELLRNSTQNEVQSTF